MMRGLTDLARIACEEALRAGADQASASAASGWSIAVEVENSHIKSASRHQGAVLMAKAFVRGGRGSYIAHELSADVARRSAHAAAEVARACGPDPEFRSLPIPEEAEAAEGLFDPRVERTGVSEAAEFAREMIESSMEKAPAGRLSGGVGLFVARSDFVNSLGIESFERTTTASCSASCVVRRGEEATSFHDVQFSRTLDSFEPARVGRRAAEGALSFLGAEKPGGGRMSLILAELASLAFLRAVASAANAESIQRRRSYLAGKLGERVAWEGFSLLDDGLVPGGTYSGARDAEGAPRRRVRIFHGGVLESLLHSSYTAGKAGCKTTGHATASGLPAASNLLPGLGERPASELIAATEKGLYVLSGEIVPDMVTGEVSASVDFGFAVEAGKLARPVKNAVVGSTATEMLSGMDAVSSDYRDYGGSLAPTIRFRSAKVASAG